MTSLSNDEEREHGRFNKVKQSKTEFVVDLYLKFDNSCHGVGLLGVPNRRKFSPI